METDTVPTQIHKLLKQPQISSKTQKYSLTVLTLTSVNCKLALPMSGSNFQPNLGLLQPAAEQINTNQMVITVYHTITKLLTDNTLRQALMQTF